MLLPDPLFVEAAERRLVALTREFTMDTRTDIPPMWNEFWSREWNLPGDQEPAAYGVSYNMRDAGRFDYAIGLLFDPVPESIPDDCSIVTIPAGYYAVFSQQGPVTDIPTMFDSIFSHWLPNSGHSQSHGMVFERYPFDDNASPENMAYEIWLPVTE